MSKLNALQADITVLESHYQEYGTQIDKRKKEFVQEQILEAIRLSCSSSCQHSRLPNQLHLKAITHVNNLYEMMQCDPEKPTFDHEMRLLATIFQTDLRYRKPGSVEDSIYKPYYIKVG